MGAVGTPVEGFDFRLPPGEEVVFSGRPDFGTWLRHSWAMRLVWLWVGVVLIATVVVGGPGAAAAHVTSIVIVGLFGTAAIVFADYLICRSTRYLITNRRVAMRIGVALPGTANIPLSELRNAAVRRYPDGTGDIALEPERGLGVGYAILWPHVRPWSLQEPQPLLRALPEVDRVAELLKELKETGYARP